MASRAPMAATKVKASEQPAAQAAECPRCGQGFNAARVGRIFGEQDANGNRPVVGIRCSSCGHEAAPQEFGLPKEKPIGPTERPKSE